MRTLFTHGRKLGLDSLDKEILVHVLDSAGAPSQAQLVELTGIPLRTIQRRIAKLKAAGLIESVRTQGGTRYSGEGLYKKLGISCPGSAERSDREQSEATAKTVRTDNYKENILPPLCGGLGQNNRLDQKGGGIGGYLLEILERNAPDLADSAGKHVDNMWITSGSEVDNSKENRENTLEGDTELQNQLSQPHKKHPTATSVPALITLSTISSNTRINIVEEDPSILEKAESVPDPGTETLRQRCHARQERQERSEARRANAKAPSQRLDLNFKTEKEVLDHLRKHACGNGRYRDAAVLVLEILEKLTLWGKRYEIVKSWRGFFKLAWENYAALAAAFSEVKERKSLKNDVRNPGALIVHLTYKYISEERERQARAA